VSVWIRHSGDKAVPLSRGFSLSLRGNQSAGRHPKEAVNHMSILWIILIVILVLALLGFFSRGYW
jgi:hypothetical protein